MLDLLKVFNIVEVGAGNSPETTGSNKGQHSVL